MIIALSCAADLPASRETLKVIQLIGIVPAAEDWHTKMNLLDVSNTDTKIVTTIAKQIVHTLFIIQLLNPLITKLSC